MRKMLMTVFGIFVSLSFLVVSPVFAAKPADNNAGAQKIIWNLSGAIMPVPPYGSGDIIGSDTASKLIVNLPNGKTQGVVTGIMKGLNPSTEYTVYLSNPYVKYTPARFAGSWVWTVLGTYRHDINVTLNPDGSFSGTGGYPAGNSPYNLPGQTTENITGQITGINNITLTTTYGGPYNPGYTVTAIGTINLANGSMSGGIPWAWSVPTGAYIPASGSTGWPGLLIGIDTFTFTTNEEGNGTWHYNFKTIVPNFSVWINGSGRTILISDPIAI